MRIAVSYKSIQQKWNYSSLKCIKITQEVVKGCEKVLFLGAGCTTINFEPIKDKCEKRLMNNSVLLQDS